METILVIISAGTEWREVKQYYRPFDILESPYGEYFEKWIDQKKLIFFQGGWGKISAAASAQYAICHFSPGLVINLGTCGGFEGLVNRGEIILATQTVVYDIIEQMGDPEEAIRFYSTDLNLDWIRQPYPLPVRAMRLVSADRDILAEDIPGLKEKHSAVAGDWESGAIAWVAERNNLHCLILRGVSDLVSDEGGEAYGSKHVFESGTAMVMKILLDSLPEWVKQM
ncbi:MAG: hypothetical protein CL609_07815 [Anaerolineaceae bacterium]|nr:hypothetical protein [Anaerolineaceae bacterium]